MTEVNRNDSESVSQRGDVRPYLVDARDPGDESRARREVRLSDRGA